MNKSVESFAHKMAKNLLAKWMRDAASKGKGFGGATGTANRENFPYGIFIEYPFLDEEYHQTWDERFDDDNWESCPWTLRPPTFQELCAAGTPPKYIADIVTLHKGGIYSVIEIVHKHPPGLDKIKFMADVVDADVYIIPTNWVLGQVKKPTEIPSKFFHCHSISCNFWKDYVPPREYRGFK